MEKIASTKIVIRRFANSTSTNTEDYLAIEEPLEIKLKYKKEGEEMLKIISVTMRTPGQDAELATGFLFTEGIIKRREEIKNHIITSDNDNSIVVELTENSIPFLQNAERNFYTSSSCGVCGKTSIDAVKTVSMYEKETNNLIIDAELICRLPDMLIQHQQVFESTGGLHASALFDLQGNIQMLREDVGRHNALDKVIGASMLSGKLPLHHSILLLSGRASFELIQKANMAGIKIVVAIGAPSSLAVQLAKEAGMTLVGFVRNENFNIYSGEKRIQMYELQES